MNPLQRSKFQMLDIIEQDNSTHVVFPPSGDQTPVAIDSWKVVDGEFRGYVHGLVVIALPAKAAWVVYRRSILNRLTKEEVIRENDAAERAQRELYYEMNPEQRTIDDEEREVAKAQADHQRKAFGLLPSKTVRPQVMQPTQPTGQYL